MRDEFVIVTLPGWKASGGVLAEIEVGQQLGKPVRYLEPVPNTTPTVVRNATAAPV